MRYQKKKCRKCGDQSVADFVYKKKKLESVTRFAIQTLNEMSLKSIDTISNMEEKLPLKKLFQL